jgi:hypothetical protein
MEVWCVILLLMSIFCIIDNWLLDIYTGIAKWVMMKEEVCIRIMNNKYEDEYKGVYKYNYV